MIYLEICNKVAARIQVGLIAGNKHSQFNFLAEYCLKVIIAEVVSIFTINSAK